MRHDFTDGRLPDRFVWFNEPPAVGFERGLVVTTRAGTDFWQRTHYGFRHDDGHALLISSSDDFTLETRVEFAPRARYDQCGLLVRVDGENWIKSSVEYEDGELSRLGSVVTNLGFSDWATLDIPSAVRAMSHRISRLGSDFLLEWSAGGDQWRQMRIAHLHAASAGSGVMIGLYACSPVGDGFECRFTYVEMTGSRWRAAES